MKPITCVLAEDETVSWKLVLCLRRDWASTVQAIVERRIAGDRAADHIVTTGTRQTNGDDLRRPLRQLGKRPHQP